MVVARAHAAELKKTADLVENFATREISAPCGGECGEIFPTWAMPMTISKVLY
ncbi:MAG: hypothetical protein ACRED2_04470 [Methylocella sp.]